MTTLEILGALVIGACLVATTTLLVAGVLADWRDERREQRAREYCEAIEAAVLRVDQ